MDLREIQNLIRFVAKSGASEVKLEMGEVKITIKTSSETPKQEVAFVQQPMVNQQVMPVGGAPVVPTQQVAPVQQEETPKNDEESKYITVKSPMIGTFYRRSAPNKPMMVEVGDAISEGTPLCIIEAMKLFNEIESEVSGKIVKILVDDASPVEYDQPLFLVDPS